MFRSAEHSLSFWDEQTDNPEHVLIVTETNKEDSDRHVSKLCFLHGQNIAPVKVSHTGKASIIKAGKVSTSCAKRKDRRTGRGKENSELLSHTPMEPCFLSSFPIPLSPFLLLCCPLSPLFLCLFETGTGLQLMIPLPWLLTCQDYKSVIP